MMENQKENIGTLFIVATPIGNLEDMSYRAVRILSEVSYVLAEDTRKTKILIDRYGLHAHLESYHAHTNDYKKERILLDLLTGKDVALVTDAGTPGISDPGNELVDFIIRREPSVPIVPIPGASALTTLISVSGLDMSKFTFVGFLPKKKTTKLLESLISNSLPFIFYESPYRIEKTLLTLKSVCIDKGLDANIVIGRELTKKFEEVLRGNLQGVIEKVQTTDRRGEHVVIIAPEAQKNGQTSNAAA